MDKDGRVEVWVHVSGTQRQALVTAARSRSMATSDFIRLCSERYERAYAPLGPADDHMLVAADVLTWTCADLAADEAERDLGATIRSLERLARSGCAAPALRSAKAAAKECTAAIAELFGLLDAERERAGMLDPAHLHPLEQRVAHKEDPCPC